MTSHQRASHVSKVNVCKVTDFKNSASVVHAGRETVESEIVLSVSAATALGLSINNIEGIWTKTLALLNNENAIVPTPGQDTKQGWC